MSDLELKVSVIVPVYRGAPTIAELVERVICVFEALPRPLEIILVNDCSPDDSWAVIQSLAERYPQVTGLNLIRNFGQHNALLAGIRSANGDIIVTMDDDLQNPPEEIPKLLAGVDDGHAVTYGVPNEGRHGAFRDLSSRVAKLALRYGLGFKHASNTSAFRAFRTQLREAFRDFDAKFVSIDVLLTWGTNDFSHAIVDHKERQRGTSGYSFRKLWNHTVNMVTSFSTIPLRIASMVGFVFFLFGVCVLLYSLSVFLLHGRSVPGFTFIASIIAIFSGVQLFSLGIIGEYLARIHQKALNEPCYVVADVTGDGRS